MPRTVNFSGRSERPDDRKPADAPAEARLFGFLRKAPVTPSALPDAPLPAPTTEEMPEPAPVVVPAPEKELSEQLLAKAVPAEIVAENGGVDFDALFQGVGIPAVTVNAEHAISILESIPAEVPLRVKRLLVKTSLNVMNDVMQASSVPANIVADAAQKMLWIARVQENLATQIEEQRTETHQEIALLETQIAAKRADLAQAEARADAALGACRQRFQKLNEVNLFFDPETIPEADPLAHPATADAGADEEQEELPPHLRADSVARLLGLSEREEAEGRRTLAISSLLPERGGERRNGILR